MDAVGSAAGVRRAYAGWFVVALAVVAVALLWLVPAQAREGAEDEELANPAAFAESSYANNCTQCHGPNGGGATVPGTDREGPASARLDDLPLFAAPVRAKPVAPASPPVDPLRMVLATIDPDEMTPREALEALYRLKREGG